MYVGVTDRNWFEFLRSRNSTEVNFWRPGGSSFKALKPGELFLFKLHNPNNFIVGGGYFVRYSNLPLSLAWEAFGNENGVETFDQLVKSISKYSKSGDRILTEHNIGCIILRDVFYFEEKAWIPIPQDWSSNIVQGKAYSTEDEQGRKLLQKIQEAFKFLSPEFSNQISEPENSNLYGSLSLLRPRLGQGAFKVLTLEAYQRKCAITGERTLPVLEAAHIQPYSQNGPHAIANGILLRRDYHALFDRGYLTIESDFTIRVSPKIKHDFGNGREYYAHQGKKLSNLPLVAEDLPSKEYLDWHNNHVYLG